MKLVKSNRSFQGDVRFYVHNSESCQGPMAFSVFIPDKLKNEEVPGLFFLSGLTCTEENFMAKAGAQQWASKWGLMLVVPDTSPRQAEVQGENESWDLGTGAGFYLAATVEKWKSYQLYRYVTVELPSIIRDHFAPKAQRFGVMGHSMGGHGALICGLREPQLFPSISAFAPIGNPVACPWGKKAFSAYLGEDPSRWVQYDACELLRAGHRSPHPIRVDQGLADEFLKEQLLPDNLIKACEETGQKLVYNGHPAFDHSYYFIASFMKQHILHHAQNLGLDLTGQE